LEKILYSYSEDAGEDVYRKYMGRIQVQYSDKETKALIDENQTGVFARAYVDKWLRVADLQEECYSHMRQLVLTVIKKLLKETQRVNEFFE
jgi:hypothetical protein